jgi:hypothetical protein
MGLLGDIGEVEVGRERPDQPDGRVEVLAFEETLEAATGLGGGMVSLLAGEPADFLDQRQQLWSVLADQGFPELGAQPPNIGSQQ